MHGPTHWGKILYIFLCSFFFAWISVAQEHSCLPFSLSLSRTDTFNKKLYALSEVEEAVLGQDYNFFQSMELPTTDYLTLNGHMERYLSNPQNIVDCKYLGGGAEDSYKLTYSNGLKSVFKLPGNKNSFALIDSEVLAYELAKMLGIKNIPPTTFLSLPKKIFKNLVLSCPTLRKSESGVVGSAQTYIHKTTILKSYAELTPMKWPHLGDSVQYYLGHVKGPRLNAFDFLIFDCDRSIIQNTIFYQQKTTNAHLLQYPPILIDHGMAFLDIKKLKKIHKLAGYSNYCSNLIMLENHSEELPLKVRCDYAPDKEMYDHLRSAHFNESVKLILRGKQKLQHTERKVDLGKEQLQRFEKRMKILMQLYRECSDKD